MPFQILEFILDILDTYIQYNICNKKWVNSIFYTLGGITVLKAWKGIEEGREGMKKEKLWIFPGKEGF